MTPLTFKKLRETLNLSATELGELITPPVNNRTVRRWESGKIALPSYAIDVINRSHAVVIHNSNNIINYINSVSDPENDKEAVILICFKSFQDLKQISLKEADECKSHKIYNAGIVFADTVLKSQGFKTYIIKMNIANYMGYLEAEGRSDCFASRTDWGYTQLAKWALSQTK